MTVLMASADPSLRCPDCGSRLSDEAWGENLCLMCLLRLAAPTPGSIGEAPTEAVGDAAIEAPKLADEPGDDT
jgi:hypothetical protein